MNAIGVGAAFVLLVAALGATACFFAFDLARLVKTHLGQPFWVWAEPQARRRFLIFIVVCALGPLSALVGFLFGNWPTD